MTQSAAKCWAVLPAAGIGTRMQCDTPKQYLEIDGVTLLEYSLQALLACGRIEQIAVALHAEDSIAQSLAVFADARVRRVTGAAQRSGSVLAGLHNLEAVAAPDDWVLVHDAARPCLSSSSLGALMQAVMDSGVGGILAEPVVDTVKRAGSDGMVEQTLDRSQLWRAQTPQMFRLRELLDALESAERAGLEITDEASAMEFAGHKVQLVPGEAANLKVTRTDDLALAAWYLAQH